MKRNLLFFGAIALSASLQAQTQVNKTTVSISKDFQKGEIVTANLNDNNQIEIVLAVQKKKEVKMMQFSFDKDAKKIDEKEMQYDIYKSKNKELPQDGKQKLPRFVWVDVTSLFMGDMTLNKGYIVRNYVNNRFISETREIESSYKVQTDDGRKLSPIGYMHCDNVSLSTKDFGLRPSGYFASGDFIALGSVMGKLMTKGRMGIGSEWCPIDYCIVKASAKTLDVEKKTLIPFKYVQRTEICKEVTGKRLMLITKDDQTNYKGQEEFFNKGSNLRTITIVNKDAEVESQFSFEGLPEMELISAEMVENGNIYLIARVGKKKEMGMVMIKLADKKAVYIQKNLLSEMESIVVKPSNEKKHKLFSEVFPDITIKTRTFKGVIELNNKHVVAVYQDPEKTGRLYYLQFDETGKLLKHYTHTVGEELTSFKNDKWQPIELSIKQTGNNMFYPLIREIKQEGTYLNVCKIDCNAGSISNFTSFGTKTSDDKNEYYLDSEFPMIDTQDGGVILIGRTGDKDILWVDKIKFE